MEEHKPFTAGFRVIRQDEQQDFSSPDAAGTIWTVHFKTDHGVESSVQVPDSEYNAETVGRLIAEKVKRIGEVHALGGAEALQAYR